MLGCILLVFGGTVVGGVSAQNTETLRTRSVFDINYRQVDNGNVEIPFPVSSPGPPPPNVPTIHVVATPPPPQTPDPPTLVFSFISSSTPAAQTPISSPIVSPITTSPTFVSQITINALPPVSSSDLPNTASNSKKKSEENQKFKLIYLAPVFALLGILWGSLTAWFAYGCITRKPKVINEDSTVGGPRYLPAESDEIEGHRDVEEGRLMREIEKAEQFRWPSVKGKLEVAKREAEDDPFLVPPPMHQGRTSKSTHSTRTAVSIYSDANSMFRYDSEAEEKLKEDEVPWESLRHKSIKRGILEQVKKEGSWIDSLRGITGSSFSRAAREAETDIRVVDGATGSGRRASNIGRRVGHTRTDSDMRVQDVNLKSPERVTLKSQHSDYSSGYSTQPSTRNNSTRTPVRCYSSQTVHSQDIRDGTQWVSGGGFRIVEESPLPTPKEPEISRSRFSSGWWWGSGADVDRYTPVPPRRDRSRSRSSSPIKGTREAGRNSQHSHANVLPQSPPQITSPPLESQLCFTPTPGSKARMTSMTTSSTAKRRKSDNATTPTKSSGKKRGKKLLSPRVPLLPFPDKGVNSPRPDVHRLRLVKPAPKVRPLTAEPLTSTSGSSYDHDAEIASDALRRVEEIIGQSWSTRDLGEEGVRSLSPTGFGRRL
ncbi:hypothetical protein BDZ94DRAFT_965174 [Collybia nuda]|uniref:Transmembrane protein n=1 Tax=Collybia nuda TaxID=64659 RepID=A0A9P5YET1_9AGAR|nr:hypothetical protein BDZ94DRAFT_965174 [Collybia nuda]